MDISEHHVVRNRNSYDDDPSEVIDPNDSEESLHFSHNRRVNRAIADKRR